jgi:Na+:H+ antiporter, NhaA family
MTFFFLLVGLEISRELYFGELSSVKKALLPVIAALGGSIIPPMIHFSMNHGLPSQPGAWIPMATDIAFAIAIVSILGRSIPYSLKVFLIAFAIIDDLFAIIVMSVMYSDSISLPFIGASVAIVLFLIAINRMGCAQIWPYLFGGVILWLFFHKAGIHSSMAGVVVAFTLPKGDGIKDSPSFIVQHRLHYPVAFIVMPLFALANTGITINSSLTLEILSYNSLGIMIGLFAGKVIGISSFALLSRKLGLTHIPKDWKLVQLIGVGFLGGIGFTMSIFISILAFDNGLLRESSKLSILIGSTISGVCGFILLKIYAYTQRNNS